VSQRKHQPFALLVARAAPLAVGLLAPSVARAQNSSLFQQDVPAATGAPLSLSNSSFLFQPAEPPRVIKLNDLITIIVDEKSQMSNEGNLQRRKQGQLNATLQDWIQLDGLNIKKAPQAQGQPEINGTLQGQFQARSNLETRDGLKLRIQSRVVDIRPNGHLVLEAHQRFKINEDDWERSISGIVDPRDVLPNNTVVSENIAELSIFKKERGEVRDGYRRGWLFYLLDRYGMF